MSKKILLIIVAILILDAAVFFGGDISGEDEGEFDVRVAVTIPPQKQFVEKVGGEKVKVTVMVPPGEEPHSYEPTPKQMREMAKSDIYFKLGSQISFESRWMGILKDYNEKMKIRNTSEGITLKKMGSSIDPHVWMSPNNAVKMVENIEETLSLEDSANSDFYHQNAQEFISRLNALHTDLAEKLKKYEGEKFMVYHPSFGYFADEYGLKQVPIEEEGKEPGTRGLQAIIDQAKEENVSVIFVSPQFDKSRAQTIADELDGEVVTLNPLAGDYLDNIMKMKNRLISTFENQGRNI